MKVIEMKNKKALEFRMMAGMVISLVLVVAVIVGLIRGILGNQIAFAGGKTEEITTDCDGDDVIGFSDLCPCNKNKQKKEDLPCGTIDPPAADICPKLCKK